MSGVETVSGGETAGSEGALGSESAFAGGLASFYDPKTNVVSDDLLMGVLPLSTFTGPRRMRKRLAKKWIRRSETLPLWKLGAAMKTLRRAQNRQRRLEWATLTEEEKGRRRLLRLVTLCLPIGPLAYLWSRQRTADSRPLRARRRRRR